MARTTWHGPAKAKKPPPGTEGVTYVSEWCPVKMRRVRRKATLADLERTAEACARSQAASDEIRRNVFAYTNGKPPTPVGPLPPNGFRRHLAEALQEARAKQDAKPARRRAKPRVTVSTDGGRTFTTPERARAVHDGPDTPPTAAKVQGIARQALAVLGLTFPETAGEASELSAQLEARLA